LCAPKRQGRMKKTLTLVLWAILGLTCLAAVSQVVDKQGKEWINAILFGKADGISKLIEAGRDVNMRFDFGASRDITPLYFAVLMGEAEVSKLLIDAGADFKVDFDGLSLLHVAGVYGGNEAVAELLVSKGLDVNAKCTARGETLDATPLHAAAGKGNLGVAKVLISHGAELEAALSQNLNTPLHLAARNGKKDLVEMLFAEGANVNAKTRYGETPLDLAMTKGHKELAEWLVEHGGVTGK